jgi:hypothetical protein
MTVSYDPEWLLISPIAAEKGSTGVAMIDDLLEGNFKNVLTSPAAVEFFLLRTQDDLKYDSEGHLGMYLIMARGTI